MIHNYGWLAYPARMGHQRLSPHRFAAIGADPAKPPRECKGGYYAWVPLYGCKWQAKSAAALAKARALGGDWLTGVKYLARAGSEDGLGAALQEVNDATIAAAAKAGGWTAQEVTDLMRIADDKAVAFRTARREAKAALAKLPPRQADALRAEYHNDLYGSAVERLSGLYRQLFRQTERVNAQVQGWAAQTAANAGFAAPKTSTGDYGVVSIPTATAVVILVAIVATTLIIIKTLTWLIARERELTTRAIAEGVRAGELPASALTEQQDRLETQAENEGAGEWEWVEGALKWGAVIAVVTVAAPVVMEALSVRKLARA